MQQKNGKGVKEMASQKKITNRLQSLEELDGISVGVSGPTRGTIHVRHKKHHAPEFHFHWSSDHFIGHFIDGDGKESQAVVSLYTPMDAIHFVSAYATLDKIRANQKEKD
jgi:hypothetical protein